MNTTQENIPIKEIADDIVFLKNGSGALVLQVSAVNFGLLSEREQVGIIESFAQTLNSLSFSIQILIYSKRLNIASYLALLDKARQAQPNPLLGKMMANYRQFIQNLIKENEVLDKQFFCIIPLYNLELGLISSKERLSQKIKTILLPRRDQVIKQLARAGLRATQLATDRLVELFYDIYNGVTPDTIDLSQVQTQPIKLNAPDNRPPTEKQVAEPKKEEPPAQKNAAAQAPQSQPPATAAVQSGSRNHPFIVEELEDNA